jgi:hypothetical protein
MIGNITSLSRADDQANGLDFQVSARGYRYAKSVKEKLIILQVGFSLSDA